MNAQTERARIAGPVGTIEQILTIRPLPREA